MHSLVKTAWAINPNVAVQLRYRFASAQSVIDNELRKVGQDSEIKVCDIDESLSLLRTEDVSALDSRLRVGKLSLLMCSISYSGRLIPL